MQGRIEEEKKVNKELEARSFAHGATMESLRKQAEHGHAVGRANMDSTIRNHRRDEFVSSELVAAVS